MKLTDYLSANGGAAAMAQALDVSPEAVRLWAVGERFPRPATARRIVSITKGQVTLSDLYAPSKDAA
jgi:DNA-binding transcriptional regulator YdaS (Cro superfamily)